MDAPETKIFIGLVIAGTILAFMIGYFLVSVIRQQKKTIALNKAIIIAEITAQEKERSRIATDLHDELGPLISSVKMKVNSFMLTDHQDLGQLEKVNDMMDTTVRRMREISFDLLPSSLLRNGLIPALRLYINKMESDALKIKLQSSEEWTLEEHKLINIYRIIQEIIQNTYKYAQATELILHFSRQENKFIFLSSDNGTGFDYSRKIKESEGFGLRSIIRRVELMDGNLYIESANKKGTRYTIEIPV